MQAIKMKNGPSTQHRKSNHAEKQKGCGAVSKEEQQNDIITCLPANKERKGLGDARVED